MTYPFMASDWQWLCRQMKDPARVGGCGLACYGACRAEDCANELKNGLRWPKGALCGADRHQPGWANHGELRNARSESVPRKALQIVRLSHICEGYNGFC